MHAISRTMAIAMYSYMRVGATMIIEWEVIV